MDGRDAHNELPTNLKKLEHQLILWDCEDGMTMGEPRGAYNLE